MIKLISVIIPIYNAEKYLRKSLNSLIEQSYSDLEIILIDDGSTDDSLAICEELIKVDHRIVLFKQEKKGASAARNLGLSRAHGDFIGFMDSDDWIEPTHYEELFNLQQKYDADISVSNFIMDYEKTNKSEVFDKTSTKEEQLSREEAILEIIKPDNNRFLGHLWNKIFRSTVIKGLTFDCNLVQREDLLFVYQAIAKANKIVYTPKYSYHYIQRPGSLMHSQYKKNIVETIKAMEYIYNDVRIHNKKLIPYANALYVKCNLKQATLAMHSKADSNFLRLVQENINEYCGREEFDKSLYSTKEKLYICLIKNNLLIFKIIYKGVIHPARLFYEYSLR